MTTERDLLATEKTEGLSGSEMKKTKKTWEMLFYCIPKARERQSL